MDRREREWRGERRERPRDSGEREERERRERDKERENDRMGTILLKICFPCKHLYMMFCIHTYIHLLYCDEYIHFSCRFQKTAGNGRLSVAVTSTGDVWTWKV